MRSKFKIKENQEKDTKKNEVFLFAIPGILFAL